MKIIDLEKGIFIPESYEDLWVIEKILDIGDIIESKTTRSIKINNKEERKNVYITLKIEKIDFSKFKNALRLTGKIIEGKPEDLIQKGKYHTIEVKANKKIKIKKQLLPYEKELILKAEKKSKKPIIFICLIDDEEAGVFKIMPYHIEKVYDKKIKISKYDEHKIDKKQKVLTEIANYLLSLDGKIIVAGPGFEKYNLAELIKQKGHKNIIIENTNHTDIPGVKELISKNVINRIYKDERNTKYTKILNEFLYHLSKNTGLAIYGIEEIKKAIDSNALKEMLVCDRFIKENKDVKKIIKKIKEINIVSYDEDIGEQVYGFGGIIGISRFPIDW